MKIISVFCIFCLIIGAICFEDWTLFIRSYLHHKNLQSCTFLSCLASQDILTMTRKVGVPSRVWSIRRYINDISEGNQRNNMLYILFDSCNSSLEALKKAGERHHLKYKDEWLILLKFSDDISLSEFESTEFRFDSDVKIAMWSQSNIMNIYEVYNTGYKKNGCLTLSYYGCWNESTGTLFVNYSSERYHKKSVLSGVVLTTSTVITNPELMDDYETYLLERKPVDLISKFSYSLFIIFQQMHNFTHVRKIQDKWFGNDVGGFEEGVAKDLHDDTSDMSSITGLIKTTRVEFYDFINPMYRFSYIYAQACLYKVVFGKLF